MKRFERTRRSRSVVRCSLIGACLVAACSGLGCQRSLFPANEPRTQFDAYDAMRNRYTPLKETDVFGRPRPALRARLNSVE